MKPLRWYSHFKCLLDERLVKTIGDMVECIRRSGMLKGCNALVKKQAVFQEVIPRG